MTRPGATKFHIDRQGMLASLQASVPLTLADPRPFGMELQLHEPQDPASRSFRKLWESLSVLTRVIRVENARLSALSRLSAPR